MVIADLDTSLPVGSPVDVEFAIDVKHNIQVRVLVREAGRCETATIEAAPPARRPTRAEIDEVRTRIDELLPDFSGSYRSRVRSRVQQLVQDLHEALRYEDEPKAIQRMAELRELLQQLEVNRGQVLNPPWTRFAQLAKHCLHLAGTVAKDTGRNLDELLEYIHAQERYAEQAYEEKNQRLYRECWDNLEKYAGYLDQVRRDALPEAPRGPARPPEDDARDDVERYRRQLADVWKLVREKGRKDLDERMRQLADQGKGLSQRVKTEPYAVLRETRRLMTELNKIDQPLRGGGPATPDEDAGLLEGTP
jgi:hypothetical protein